MTNTAGFGGPSYELATTETNHLYKSLVASVLQACCQYYSCSLSHQCIWTTTKWVHNDPLPIGSAGNSVI